MDSLSERPVSGRPWLRPQRAVSYCCVTAATASQGQGRRACAPPEVPPGARGPWAARAALLAHVALTWTSRRAAFRRRRQDASKADHWSTKPLADILWAKVRYSKPRSRGREVDSFLRGGREEGSDLTGLFCLFGQGDGVVYFHQ